MQTEPRQNPLLAPVRKEGGVIAAHHSLLRAGGASRSFAVVPAKSGNIYGPKVYLNGEYANTTFPGSATSPQLASYIDVANRSNNPNRGSDMAVYAIRVYNRILTDAEIAANYAIDKARFNLP